MRKTLVIVESPTKAKTISKFLGRKYTVRASMGHVIDLPKSQFGIDIENNFKPKYITIRGKGKILRELKYVAKKADRVLLAADPDREGEAICWHLGKALGINENEPCRVEFNEITKNKVLDAFNKPRYIDYRRINAQQARRILDRLVGYKISPILWRKVKKGLSAGRVQSVAVRLVCDREREIINFTPEEYWTLEVKFTTDKGKNEFIAKFYGKKNQKIQLSRQEEVEQLIAELEQREFVVDEVKRTQRKRNPAPSFTTSSLQQEAARRLGFSTKKTMAIAQQLYEGINLGRKEGVTGLITYIRTDSHRISPEAQEHSREFIKKKYGEEFVPPTPRKYPSKKGAQEAHEAIRPTVVSRAPDDIKASLTQPQYQLYKLIWERFLASQMASAVLDQITVNIKAGEYLFKSTGTSINFPGFMVLYVEEENSDSEKADGGQIPSLKEGQKIVLANFVPRQHFTQPPPRYTEASLVKILEEKGIGRPSTYSPIIETIQSRGYVIQEDRVFKPTDLGLIVVDLLKEYFPEILDIDFTAQLEEKLDEIEEGKIDWVEVIRHFFEHFKIRLHEAEKNMEKVDVEEPTDETCPQCGRSLVVKYGRFGRFLACPGFPECRFTKPLLKETGVACPFGDGVIVERRSKKGRKFYGCSNYPDCRFVLWNQPVQKNCPRCGFFLVIKGSRDKKYLCCGNKDCDYCEDFNIEKKKEK